MKHKEESDVEIYINSKREMSDGVLTEYELVKYNIMNDRKMDTVMRMIAYEEFLIKEGHWRYPSLLYKLSRKIKCLFGKHNFEVVQEQYNSCKHCSKLEKIK